MHSLLLALGLALALPAYAQGPASSAPPDAFAIVHLKPRALGETALFRRLTDETFMGQTLRGMRLGLGERLGGDPVADVHGVTAYVSGSLAGPRFAVRVDGVVPVARVRAALQAEGWAPDAAGGPAWLRSSTGAYLAHVVPGRVLIGPAEHLAWMHAARGVAPAFNPLLERTAPGDLGWIVAHPPGPLTVLGERVSMAGGLWGALRAVDDTLVVDGELEFGAPAEAARMQAVLAAAQARAALSPEATHRGLGPAWRRPVMSAQGRALGVWITAGVQDLDQLVQGLMTPPPPEPPAAGRGRPTPPGLRFDWVKMPAGKVTLRRKCGVTGEPPPAKGTSVRGFALSRHEVTVAQYRVCVEAGECSEPRRGAGRGCNWGVSGRDQHPMNCVTPLEASVFAEWAGARLPFEEEWAYAARGGSRATPLPWGDAPVDCGRATVTVGGRRGCGAGHTAPVCSKVKGHSPQGVCDLAGNVAEFVLDIELEEAFRYEGPDVMGPDGRKAPPPVDPPPMRVRGGRWDAGWVAANVFERPGMRHSAWSPGVGFRVARWTEPR